MRKGGGLTGLPVKATVRQDSCYPRVFFVVKHLCSEDRRLVDKNTQGDVPHLWDGLGQTDDGGHIAFWLCDSVEAEVCELHAITVKV